MIKVSNTAMTRILLFVVVYKNNCIYNGSVRIDVKTMQAVIPVIMPGLHGPDLWRTLRLMLKHL